jgi:sugar lactone lactonase
VSVEAKVGILSDIRCELGEGPTYDPATDTLWWFDITGRRLLEHAFPGGPTKIHELPLMASALAFTASGEQVLATEHGVQLRDPATGKLAMLAPIEADNDATRSNDARVHQSGAFWIGTMAKDGKAPLGSIYHFLAGEVRTLFTGITIPNSICFSPQGDTAYYADTRRNLLFRVDCDPATGLPSGEPSVLLDHQGKPGGLDGSVCDADGVIWNARWGSGRLDAYAPDGSHLQSIALPARQTSCPAFVGKNAGSFAVTSALQGMDAAACAADPDPLVADLRDGGHVLFVRHAATAGDHDRTDDPADCEQQRNLTDAGRADAAAIGAAIDGLDVPVVEVLASRWCRSLDTAELAFDEVVVDDRLLPSADPDVARDLLTDPPTEGNRVLVGHLSTITGLTGVHLEEGDTAVFAPGGELVDIVPVDAWEELSG